MGGAGGAEAGHALGGARTGAAAAMHAAAQLAAYGRGAAGAAGAGAGAATRDKGEVGVASVLGGGRGRWGFDRRRAGWGGGFADE